MISTSTDLALRILHLEDDSGDAALVQRALAKDGIRCEIARVTSQREFIAAIDAGHDLILADYALPGFDGVSAQTIARDRCPDVPFVFVSGTMGEEFAVDRLKDGATDYVLKHNLSRLPAAVRRALQEATDRRKAREAQAEVGRLNGDLERRVTERTGQLAAANAFLDSIIENLPDMIFVKESRDLRFVRLNRAAEQMLGLNREILLGHSDAEVFSPDLAEAFIAADRRVLASGAVVDIAEEAVATTTRGTRLFHTKKIPVVNAATGEPEYLLGISRDITDQKAAEEAVRSARAEAERASRAKSEFLSRMSHDLRTPLNAILGFAQLLEMEPLTFEQTDNVRQILRGGRHLLELINEVLDIARIEAGHLSLSTEPVSVAEAAHHVIDLVRPLADHRRIAVGVDEAVDPTLHVHADRQRLMQVLMNLVGNAVKYNREGGRVRLTWTAADGRVRVCVTDNGAGIQPEKLTLLFQPFERLGADQSAIEGTGLGLAVAKGLTEAMGGTIGVSSIVDQGSTFWVDLAQTNPLAVSVPVAADVSVATAALGTGTVLYVEDNRSNVRLLERLLTRRGRVRLLTTASGVDAVRLAHDERPDLILLDLHLPDIGGEEVLRRLWSSADTRRIPVAVLSADATTKQSQRLLASGAVAYLTKPLDLTRLLRLLDDTLPTAGIMDREVVP